MSINGNETKPDGLFLSNKTYSSAKFFAGIVLPAAGTLYFALATIWNLPAAKEILGTIVAFQAFLGVILGISSNQYEKSGAKYSGDINVVKTPDKTIYALELNHPAEELENMKEATFKILPPDGESQ